MKKLIISLVTLIVALSLFAGAASAHVTVGPKETSQGAYEMFTLKVPSEKGDVTTTKVQVLIPEDVNITRFEPKPGWTYEIQKDDSDKITSVTWTTEGEGLSATEFGQFNMNGKVGDKATEIVWKAIQTYSDGSVVEWVEAEEANYPASVTVVNPAGASAHGHGEKTTEKDASSKEKVKEEVKETSSSNTPLYLSIAALAAGLIGLVLSLKKRG
ncbi:YcnI family protein [Neobacillus sp. DY30]|uniref:YcnI family copper-binding membrane protein n=1 Tax=Neobacillus sp. DY30 TaxID=3047871 RepID=UPI0024C0B195|nr:YcnI family protein [Neobacillus sp. DY30]WHX99955.1 YcnI family protein [Neobacillus sp. DY30]